MVFYRPIDAGISNFVEPVNNAPVNDPDGTTGITLNVGVDE
jgi:hypothetical protein